MGSMVLDDVENEVVSENSQSYRLGSPRELLNNVTNLGAQPVLGDGVNKAVGLGRTVTVSIKVSEPQRFLMMSLT